MIDELPKPEKIEEAILITHAQCTDGAGCATLFTVAGGKPENIRYIPAGGVERFLKKDPIVESDKFLIFADLGVTSTRLADELEKRGSVVLLDHHKTSQHLAERTWCNVDMHRCGTQLMLEYVSWKTGWGAEPIETWVWLEWNRFGQLVADRDLWKNKELPVSRELVDLMNFVGQEEFVKRMASWPWRKKYQGGTVFTKEEQFAIDTLEKARQRNFAEILKRAVVVTRPWGKTVYVVSSDYNISDLLDQALQQTGANVAAQINFDKNMVSLRSRDGTDVSAIAKRFGGGGHKAAAGHPLPLYLVDTVIGETHDE